MSGTEAAVARTAVPGRETSSRPATWIPPGAVLVGGVLLAAASVLPVWASRLLAPQYPGGLWLWAYGGWVEGDLNEINNLNHYVGMRPFDANMVPEMVLWLPMLVGLSVAVAFAVYQRGLLGRLALIGLWLAPLGVLADIQRWLYIFGTDLDPRSALRLEPFVPLAIGPTEVWNFTVWAFPGPGLVLLFVVALLATLARRRSLPSVRVRLASAIAAFALVMLVAVIVGVTRLLPAQQASAPAPPVAVGSGDHVHAAHQEAEPFDLAAAVRDASPGSVLRVPSGTYLLNLVIDKPISLLADGHVMVDGGGQGQVIRIEADDVLVRGLHVMNSGGQVQEGAGILVLGDNARLEQNLIDHSYTGIAIHGASGATIVNNRVIGQGQVVADVDHAIGHDAADGSHEAPADSSARVQGDGISLWNVSSVLIRDNEVRGVRDGLYLSYADDVLVDTNRITESRYAVHTMFGSSVTLFGNEITDNLSGLVLMYTDGVVAGRNEISDHRSAATGVGILLKDVRAPLLRENVLLRNQVGLHAEGTGQTGGVEAVVYANRIAANRVGVALMASADLSFGANSFDENLTQVLALERGVDRRNVWAYRGLGNAWSDYTGYDVGGDGIGDVPYVSGGVATALLTRSPALELLTTSPAFHLLATSQAWWSVSFAPAVIDTRPLTQDVAPPAAAGRPADQPAGWAALGALLVLPAFVVTAWLRRPVQ
jgi:nitrous oxidase accessory protein